MYKDICMRFWFWDERDRCALEKANARGTQAFFEIDDGLPSRRILVVRKSSARLDVKMLEAWFCDSCLCEISGLYPLPNFVLPAATCGSPRFRFLSTPSAHRALGLTMGRDNGKKTHGKSKGVKKDNQSKGGGEKPKFVPRYHYFAKSKLASYPNEDGACVYLEKNHDEKDFFKLKTILKSRTSSNEELCHRPGMGLALDAASVHHGTQVLRKHFEKPLRAIPAEHTAALDKTGLPKLLEILGSKSGKEFVDSLAVLNVGKTGQPTEEAVKAAVKTFVQYLQDPTGELHRSLTRLASDAAGLYLFAMTLLKDMALVQNPQGWADKVDGKQIDAVKAWKRKPTDEKKLRQALVAALMAKVQENEPPPSKKRKVSDSSAAASASGVDSASKASGGSSEASSTAGSKGSGTSSSGKSSAKSSDSSSSSPPKKDANDKKKKKKKKEKAEEKKEKSKEKQEKLKEKKEKTKEKKEESSEKKTPKDAEKAAKPAKEDKKDHKKDKAASTKDKKGPKVKKEEPGKSNKEKKTKGEPVTLDSDTDLVESSSPKEKKHDKDKKLEKSRKAEQKQKDKELQAKKRRQKEEAVRAAAEEEARAAAFTVWPAANVQEVAEKLEEAKASIGLLTGRFKKEDLATLARLIPTQVLDQFPEVCVATAELANVEGDWVSNKEAKPALVMLIEVANTVAAFWAEHADTAAPSGEQAEGAEEAQEAKGSEEER